LKFSYRIKLTLIIALLSVFLTSVGMWVFYSYTYTMMIEQMGKNLIDVGRLATTLFDADDRAAILKLKWISEQEMILSREEVLTIPPTRVKRSLAPVVSDRLHARKDFQELAEKLEIITFSSLRNVVPDEERTYKSEDTFEYLKAGMIGPYIVVPVAGFPSEFGKYLVAPSYAQSGDWPGNPIGTLLHSILPMSKIWDGNVYVTDHIIPDEFFPCLAVLVPIMDEKGIMIAALGLDYAPGKELNKLKQLAYLSYAVIALSFIIGLILSFIVSKRMSSSLHQLHDAAMQIKNQNFDVHVDISTKDEFGLLGRVFNQMAVAVRQTVLKLHANNDLLRSVTADMHDGVGSVLAGIQVATGPHGSDTSEHINKLSRQGLDEVRVLMDALEYDDSDFNLLCEGIELLACDILKPQNIAWTMQKTAADNPEIQFKLYLDLQRIAREAFTNIVKHSSADECTIDISYVDGTIHLAIYDNGHPHPTPLVQGSGRGLENMKYRVGRHRGLFKYYQDESGFRIDVEVCFDNHFIPS